jgi:hypothetical protein
MRDKIHNQGAIQMTILSPVMSNDKTTDRSKIAVIGIESHTKTISYLSHSSICAKPYQLSYAVLKKSG